MATAPSPGPLVPALLRVVRQLRDDAAVRRDAANENAARCYERAAKMVEDAVQQAGDELLSPTEAALATGYSADHVGRLVRDGRIPNAGRPNAPKIRRGDLPSPRPSHTRACLPSAALDSTFPPTREQIAGAVVHLHHKRAG